MQQSYFHEVWKPLILKEGTPISRYEISSFGRIRRYAPHKNEPIYINGLNKKTGVRMITFNFKSGKQIGKLFHRLVAKTFLEKPSPKHNYVIHLNYIKTDNSVKNLKWVTKEEAYAHTTKSPNRVPPPKKRGEEVNRAKLTEAQVKLIKIRLKRWELGIDKIKLVKLAKQYDISYMQLYRIRTGENWGHVKITEKDYLPSSR